MTPLSKDNLSEVKKTRGFSGERDAKDFTMSGRSAVVVRFESPRLVYYRRSMGRTFGEEHWRACDSPQFYTPYL